MCNDGAGSGCGRDFMVKGEWYAGIGSAVHYSFSSFTCLAFVAIQQRLGVLSQRNFWNLAHRSHYSAPDWCSLISEEFRPVGEKDLLA
jgi:hypothetical protein